MTSHTFVIDGGIVVEVEMAGPPGLTGPAGPAGSPGPAGPAGPPGAAGGVTDHGLLTGLSDDDHPQYLKPSEVVAGANVTVDSATIPGSVIINGAAGGAGSTDHHTLTNLTTYDDHTQYHNNARGDARYPLIAHTHTQAQSHNTPDTDGSPTALHHTLGTGANQAAAGSHTHTAAAVGAEASGAVATHDALATAHTALRGTGAPVGVDAANPSVGTSTKFAREDHRHQVTVAAPVALGAAVAAGTSTSLARADHVHPYPTAANVGAPSVSSLFGRSVVDYGADPTGVALCDTAFTNALAANAVVYVPIGTYKISQPITIVSGKTLVGAKGPRDWETPNQVSKIIQSNVNQPIIKGTAVAGVRLENLYLTAVANHTVDGVFFLRGAHGASNYIDVVNVHVEAVGRDGFSVENLIVSTWTGAAATACKRYGIHLYGQEGGAAGTSVTLNSCFVNACLNSGYRIRTMTYISLNACAADANTGVSYDISQSSGVSLSGCGAEGAKTDAFRIWDWVTGASLNGCWAYATEAGAVFDVYGSRGIVLSGCSELASVAAVKSFLIDDDSTVTVVGPHYDNAPTFGYSTTVLGDEGIAGSLLPGIVTLGQAPTTPMGAANKGYVDRIRGGIAQTNAGGTATVTYPPYSGTPAFVATVMGGKGFMVTQSTPGLASCAVTAYTDAGVALQTYFSWMTMPSVMTAELLPAPPPEGEA